MRAGSWLLVSVGLLFAIYAVFIVSLVALGRRENARAIAGFVPDCAVLLGRLMREPGLPRRRWLVLVLVGGYLAMPFDLVPDFLPVIGYLDDAIVVILTLRWLLRTGRSRPPDGAVAGARLVAPGRTPVSWSPTTG